MWKTSFVDYGPMCSKSPAKSYFQDALPKIDVSQFFTDMGSKTWSMAQLERLGFTKSLTLLIAISGDVASFPYDRGKMDLDYFTSILTCMQLLCQSYQDFVKQDLCICFISMESASRMLLSYGCSYGFSTYGE